MKRIIAALAAIITFCGLATPANAAPTVVLARTGSYGSLPSGPFWPWHHKYNIGPSYKDFYVHMWWKGCGPKAFGEASLQQGGYNWGELEAGRGTHIDLTAHVTHQYWNVNFNRTFEVSWRGNRPSCYVHIVVWEYA